jgi:hypothetical protein
MAQGAFRNDREGFSFREGFSSNKRRILRDQIMVGGTASAGISGHTRQVISWRPARIVWRGSRTPLAPHPGA